MAGLTFPLFLGMLTDYWRYVVQYAVLEINCA